MRPVTAIWRNRYIKQSINSPDSEARSNSYSLCPIKFSTTKTVASIHVNYLLKPKILPYSTTTMSPWIFTNLSVVTSKPKLGQENGRRNAIAVTTNKDILRCSVIFDIISLLSLKKKITPFKMIILTNETRWYWVRCSRSFRPVANNLTIHFIISLNPPASTKSTSILFKFNSALNNVYGLTTRNIFQIIKQPHH